LQSPDSPIPDPSSLEPLGLEHAASSSPVSVRRCDAYTYKQPTLSLSFSLSPSLPLPLFLVPCPPFLRFPSLRFVLAWDGLVCGCKLRYLIIRLCPGDRKEPENSQKGSRKALAAVLMGAPDPCGDEQIWRARTRRETTTFSISFTFAPL